MLTDRPMTTMLMVREVDPAVRYYRDCLGLPHQGTSPTGEELFAVGGAFIALRPDPQATPTGRTELSFEVDDIATEIKNLESHGVTFADYDLPGLTTVDHIASLGDEKAAWFEDPDGNVLCLHQDSH